MGMTPEKRFENDLANLIHKHADWLSGEAWDTITRRVGAAYFEDCPSVLPDRSGSAFSDTHPAEHDRFNLEAEILDVLVRLRS